MTRTNNMTKRQFVGLTEDYERIKHSLFYCRGFAIRLTRLHSS